MSIIKNNLPDLSGKSQIRVSTLKDIANSIRLRQNSSNNYKVSNYANEIDATDFGIFFPGGYGGVALDQGNNLYRKYQNNATMMAPIIGPEVVNCREAFNNCKNLFGAPLMKSDICDSMLGTFRGCTNLYGEIEIGNNVSDLSFAFYECQRLFGGIPSRENVTNCSSSFYNCIGLNGMLPNFPEVTNMYQAFYNCTNVVGNIYGTKATNIRQAFYECQNVNGMIIGNFNYATDMYQAFYNCSNLIGNPVASPLATTMEMAYYNCTNLTGSAPCGNVATTMANAYYNCVNLTGAPTVGLNVTTIDNTFYNCSNMRGTPSFHSTKVGVMSYGFYNCSNLSGTVNIPSTGVSNMSFTFYNCSNLDAVVVRQTNATILKTANMTNSFVRPIGSKRLNVVFLAKTVYGAARINTVTGCDMSADTLLDEPLNVRLPYTYANGKWYGYQEITVNRVSYNEEYNIYMYSVQA